MLKEIFNLCIRFKKIILYAICSVFSALFESIIGWTLLNFFDKKIIIVNTISIILGAVLHYFLTLIIVFKIKNNYQSLLAYIGTLFIGLFLQNFVIWLFYEHLLYDFSEVSKFVISKGLSLVIPFIFMYFIRNEINEKLKKKKGEIQ